MWKIGRTLPPPHRSLSPLFSFLFGHQGLLKGLLSVLIESQFWQICSRTWEKAWAYPLMYANASTAWQSDWPTNQGRYRYLIGACSSCMAMLQRLVILHSISLLPFQRLWQLSCHCRFLHLARQECRFKMTIQREQLPSYFASYVCYIDIKCVSA